jgi:hypothetical protein
MHLFLGHTMLFDGSSRFEVTKPATREREQKARPNRWKLASPDVNDNASQDHSTPGAHCWWKYSYQNCMQKNHNYAGSVYMIQFKSQKRWVSARLDT